MIFGFLGPIGTLIYGFEYANDFRKSKKHPGNRKHLMKCVFLKFEINAIYIDVIQMTVEKRLRFFKK